MLLLNLIQDRDYYNKQSVRARTIKAEPGPFALCPTPVSTKRLFRDPNELRERDTDRERARERCDCSLELSSI